MLGWLKRKSEGGGGDDDTRQVWKSVCGWLEQNAPSSLKDLRPPASQADVADLGRAFPSVPSELCDFLACNDGEDDFGGVLGGCQLFSVKRMLEEQRSMNEARAALERDGYECDWSSEWIPVAGDGRRDLVVMDARSGEVMLCDPLLNENTLLGASLVELLERFLAELEAGFWSWSEEAGSITHRERHWIGTFPMSVPADDPVELLRYLTESLDRKPNDDELSKLDEFAVQERLAAADVLLDELGSKWVLRDRVLETVCDSVGEDGAEWLRARWDDVLHSTRARIGAAASCFPEPVAVEMALAIHDARRGDPQDLTPVASEHILVWIEENPPVHAVTKWGALVASCAPTWSRMKSWLDVGRPYSLLALDALELFLTSGVISREGQFHVVRRYELPVSAQIRDLPSPDLVVSTVSAHAENDDVPRVQAATSAIIDALRPQESNYTQAGNNYSNNRR